jgi:mannose-6-phosphate isomerase-like protein (cupin superfamily)
MRKGNRSFSLESILGQGAALALNLGLALALGLALRTAGAQAVEPAASASIGVGDPPATAPANQPAGHEEDVVKLGAARGYRMLDLEWLPGPFPGTKIAVVAGDPKTGMHHSYLQLADGTAIPPHWHSFDEYVTIASGTILLGVGDTADRGAARLFGPGAFVYVPANTRHYAFAKGPVIVSQTRAGAADLHWVNPEDDPAKAPKPAAASEGK